MRGRLLLGSVTHFMSLKCAFDEPRPPEPIVVPMPVIVPECLPLPKCGRADLIGELETSLPVRHFHTCGAESLLLVHVVELVEL